MVAPTKAGDNVRLLQVCIEIKHLQSLELVACHFVLQFIMQFKFSFRHTIDNGRRDLVEVQEVMNMGHCT